MKFLIIGMGSIGQRHAKNLIGYGHEIIAYRVRNRPVTGIKFESFDDLDNAIKQRPDAALICNLPPDHLKIAVKLTNENIPFLLEKPISNSEYGMERLIEMVEEKGLPVLVGYQMRFHPLIKKVPQFIYENGNPLAVEARIESYLPRYHSYESYEGMYESHSELGGGVLLSLSHEFDYIYKLFGIPKRVFCMGGHLSWLKVNSEDVADTLLDYGFPIHVHQDFTSAQSHRSLRINSPNETLYLDLMLKGDEWNKLFIAEIAHFIQCVNRTAQPICTLRDGLNVLKIALAAKESLKIGEAICL